MKIPFEQWFKEYILYLKENVKKEKMMELQLLLLNELDKNGLPLRKAEETFSIVPPGEAIPVIIGWPRIEKFGLVAAEYAHHRDSKTFRESCKRIVLNSFNCTTVDIP